MESKNIDKEVKRLQPMFSNLVSAYDRTNRVMSLWQDLKWRKSLTNEIKLLNSQGSILDLATGSGDQLIFNQKKYPESKIVGVDFSQEMLNLASYKYEKEFNKKPELLLNDVTQLDIPDNSFDAVTMSFGLRNMKNRGILYKEVFRVLKPKGSFYVLDAYYDNKTLWAPFYKIYFKYFIAFILKRKDESYKYLAESVLNFPVPEAIKTEMEANGFKKIKFKTFMLKSVMLIYGEKN